MGRITLDTNDADESKYTFWIDAAVTDASPTFGDPGFFTIGSTDRYIEEGGTLKANVRIPSKLRTDQVFELEYSSSSVSGPATVTIPAGQDQVVFSLAAITDFRDSGEELGYVTASVPGGDLGDTARLELPLIDDGKIKVSLGHSLLVYTTTSIQAWCQRFQRGLDRCQNQGLVDVSQTKVVIALL